MLDERDDRYVTVSHVVWVSLDRLVKYRGELPLEVRFAVTTGVGRRASVPGAGGRTAAIHAFLTTTVTRMIRHQVRQFFGGEGSAYFGSGDPRFEEEYPPDTSGAARVELVTTVTGSAPASARTDADLVRGPDALDALCAFLRIRTRSLSATRLE